MSKKVLFVDDDEYIHTAWSDRIAFMTDKIEMLHAYSIGEAISLFKENPDLDAIVMDACVPGDRPTTLFLVEEMRKTFSGPMIAVSSVGMYRQMLVKTGCDYDIDKTSLPQALMKILQI